MRPARVRVDLCDEAVRLARLVALLAPSQPEALGLAALLLAHDARRAARLDAAGRTIPLDRQDRARYDRARIAEAQLLLDRALALARPGPYQVQGAIALLHASAERAEETDWPQIAALYAALERLSPSPVVALNRAAAVGRADGPAAGLALLEPLGAGPLAAHHLLHATRAELLHRAGRAFEAVAAFERARQLAPAGSPARADLAERLAALREAPPAP